jgi:hypothetical protein
MSPVLIEQCEPKRVDIRFLAAVVGLLVLIAAILTQLWLLERNRRILAETRLREAYLTEDLRRRTEAGQVAVEPLKREQLPADQTVIWKARSRKAFRLSPQEAQSLGLRDGDVLVVCEGPSTQPAVKSP